MRHENLLLSCPEYAQVRTETDTRIGILQTGGRGLCPCGGWHNVKYSEMISRLSVKRYLHQSAFANQTSDDIVLALNSGQVDVTKDILTKAGDGGYFIGAVHSALSDPRLHRQ